MVTYKMISTDNYDFEDWVTIYDKQVKIFDRKINDEWKNIFKLLLTEEQVNNIDKCLTKSLKKNIFPYPDLVFYAFNKTSPSNIKVVIIGQDPYFNQKQIKNKCIPEAMGLSFSVPIGIPIPSSLKNIFKNLIKYGHIKEIPKHGNLKSWATQGCLMINAALTVEESNKNCHASVWMEFTNNIIKYISEKNKNIIFVLWGSFAFKKLDLINTKKHKTIICSHPSGLSYSKPMGSYESFNDTDTFGIINKYLTDFGKEKINWKTQ